MTLKEIAWSVLILAALAALAWLVWNLFPLGVMPK